MSYLILGIDPGWSGGAALLDEDGNIGEVVSFANNTESDIISDISRMVTDCDIAYIEKVGPMPKQGVVSVFKFGWINGLLRGLIIGSARTIEITPQRWQKALGCLSHGDKNVTKAKAQQLFPGIKITHSNADALLIAYYGYQQEREK